MGLVQARMETAVETSAQLIESLHMAREVALKSNVAEVLPVHLVLAMLEDDESSFLLEAYGVDFKKLRAQLGRLVQKQVRPKTPEKHAVFSSDIEKIMQHARLQAQKNDLVEVDSNLVLAVLLGDSTGFLRKLLKPFDLDMSGVLQYLELREGKTIQIAPLPARSEKTPRSVDTGAGKNKPAVKAVREASAATQKPAPPPLVHPAKKRKMANTNADSSKREPSPPAPTIPPADTPSASPAKPPAAPRAAPRPPLAAPRQQPDVPPATAANATQQPRSENTAIPANEKPADRMQQPPAPLFPAPVKDEKTDNPVSPAVNPGVLAKSPELSKSPRPAPAPVPAASGLRSMFGKIGKVISAGDRKKDKESRKEKPPSPANTSAANASATPPAGKPLPGTPETAAQTPEPQPPASISSTGADGSKPVAANNSQTAPLTATRLLPGTPGQNDGAPEQPSGETAVTNSKDTLSPEEQAAARLQLHNARRTRRRLATPADTGNVQNLSATRSVLEKGRLVENVPRRMKVNVASRAEVRITRAQMEEINSEFDSLGNSHIHELSVTEAMTVQLRAPGSGFHIENLSPQTQWIDRNQRHVNDADFGAWRWNVTPTRPGKSRLQLVISARTVDDEGTIHIADIPDKIIDISIFRDHVLILKRAGLITAVALAGIALGRYGETAAAWISGLSNHLG